MRPKAGVLGNALEHGGPNFFALMEGENKILPSLALKYAM